MYHRFTALAMAICLLGTLGLTQLAAQKKSYLFRGKVEEVSQRTRKLTVTNEKVEGWMEPMTMSYEVDDPAVLKTIKAGDLITATVYDGDYKLYQVKLAAPPAAKKGKQ
jgi:Cu/Ag efflux protein CusF